MRVGDRPSGVYVTRAEDGERRDVFVFGLVYEGTRCSGRRPYLVQ